YISTGQLDSKFGFSIESGAARAAVERALAHDRIELIGLHSHIGSQVFDLRGHVAAMEIMLDLLAELRRDLGFVPARLRAAGGVALQPGTKPVPAPPVSPGRRCGRLLGGVRLAGASACGCSCSSRSARSRGPPGLRCTPWAPSRTSPACAVMCQLTVGWATTSGPSSTALAMKPSSPPTRRGLRKRW